MKKISMEYELVKEKSSCCGCGTCALICPVHAITMEPCELGCLYPRIDPESCIHCGMCERVCAYGKMNVGDYAANKAYAAVAKDSELLRRSASGGAFASVAMGVLNSGGVVYGCSLETVEDGIKPMHIGVERLEDLHKLQGSKYVQSDLGNIFLAIKENLEHQKIVLFSGTPCQVDALNHYLGEKEYENLYTIDIVYHGVPSAELFKGYIRQMKVQKVMTFNFRDKKNGWGLCASYSYKDKRGNERKCQLYPELSSYYSYFLAGEIYRESCYHCPYACAKRVGDITIGDYWGIEQEHPDALIANGGEIDESKGVSAVLANSLKGKKMLSEFGYGLFTIDSSPCKIERWNRQLVAPSKPTDTRKRLIDQYAVLGYAGIERLFRKELGLKLLYRRIRRLLF